MTNTIEVSKDIENVSTAVDAINRTQAGIATLLKKFRGAVFDVRTAKGMNDAKSARAEIREPRYKIEHLRKEAKAPVLALGRSLDKMAADLTAEILALETPIDNMITAEVHRIENERQAVIDAENQRVHAIKEKITHLFDGIDGIIASKRTSDNIAKCIAAYRAKPIDHSFAEFTADAQQTWSAAIVRLESHLQLVIDREAEDKQIAEDQQELVRLRKAVADNPPAAADSDLGPDTNELPTSTNIGTSEDSNPETVEDDAPNTEYPGDQAIAVALADYFGVPADTAELWIQQMKSPNNHCTTLF